MPYYAPPADAAPPFWRRSGTIILIGLAHLLALLLAFGMAVRAEREKPLQALDVRLLETPPPPPPVEKPRPLPTPATAPRKAAPPPPVLTAAPTTHAVANFAVAPQPEPRPLETAAAPPAPPAPPPVLAARFDADYLQNPKPVYPPLSRRLGEEGKVVLRVRVSAQGMALSIDIKQSSTYPRLDEAARSAVEKWRFVPARQGDETIESTVLVPLSFALDR